MVVANRTERPCRELVSVSAADLGWGVRDAGVLQHLLHFTSCSIRRPHAIQLSAACEAVRRREVIASLASNLQVRIHV